MSTLADVGRLVSSPCYFCGKVYTFLETLSFLCNISFIMNTYHCLHFFQSIPNYESEEHERALAEVGRLVGDSCTIETSRIVKNRNNTSCGYPVSFHLIQGIQALTFSHFTNWQYFTTLSSPSPQPKPSPRVKAAVLARL